MEFLIALGLILAGATGNLLDSMFYDFIFPVDQYLDCRLDYNILEGSGNFTDCGFFGTVETRHTGFLFGNVVDMFKFQASWPSWMPYLGGSEVFPAIWNVADGAITVGVLMILIWQKRLSFELIEMNNGAKPHSLPWVRSTVQSLSIINCAK